MTDFIGDIHGYADSLSRLLKKMGYEHKNGCYRHPERKALFIGDYIDRGPKIRETLQIVKDMVDHDQAIALMGNHEYNALCFHTPDGNGGFLRPHTEKNLKLHSETLAQLDDSDLEHYLGWFQTLPLFYETEEFRAVHACWDEDSIAFLRTNLNNNNTLNGSSLFEFTRKRSRLYTAADIILKGVEVSLPEGIEPIADKEGIRRTEVRVKWWLTPASLSYIEYSIKPNPLLSAIPVAAQKLTSYTPYAPSEKSVFFGHYWLEGVPQLFRENICCLDFSIANNGVLAAYRHDGEIKLDNAKFVYVS